MKSLSRSSLATGPKIRVPLGCPSSLMITPELVIKTDVGAIRTTDFLGGTNDDRSDDVAFFDNAARSCFFDGANDNVADRSIIYGGNHPAL